MVSFINSVTHLGNRENLANVTPKNPGSWSGAGTGVRQASGRLDYVFRTKDGQGF